MSQRPFHGKRWGAFTESLVARQSHRISSSGGLISRCVYAEVHLIVCNVCEVGALRSTLRNVIDISVSRITPCEEIKLVKEISGIELLRLDRCQKQFTHTSAFSKDIILMQEASEQ
jgi:hypothetical protein